nr:hypothetical protein 8 [Spirochaetaceae bacterium]
MATQRYISTSFWTDKWIRSLDPSERYLYMYLLTNPETNIAGVYDITIDRIAFDTGYDERTLRPMLDRFAEAGKVYFYDDEWIILPTWPKHQQYDSRSKIRDGIEKVLKQCSKDLLRYLFRVGYQYPIDRILEPYEYVLNYTDPDLDSDTDTDTDSDTDTTSEEGSVGPSVSFETWLKEYARKADGIRKPELFVAAILRAGPGHSSWEELQTRYRDFLAENRLSRASPKTPEICPDCGGPLVVTSGRAKCAGRCKAKFDFDGEKLTKIDLTHEKG